MITVANKWVGYLEHQSDELLGVYNANVGKGGYTIFAHTIRKHYPRLIFYGLSWCVVFVHAVCIEAYGKEKAKKLLGSPQAGTIQLMRRMKRKGWLKGRDYLPKANDLIFLHNGDGEVSHVGIVKTVDGDTVISIEGNTTDPSGRLPESRGGAVAIRNRKLNDPAIVVYARIDTDSVTC